MFGIDLIQLLYENPPPQPSFIYFHCVELKNPWWLPHRIAKLAKILIMILAYNLGVSINLKGQSCDLDPLLEHLYNEEPKVGLSLEAEERVFQQYLETESKRWGSYPGSSSSTSNYSKIIIPMIFGVVHNGNDLIFQRATGNMIRSNITVVNSIYAANPIPINGQLKVIQFCLATKRSDGSSFPPGEEGIIWLDDPNLSQPFDYGSLAWSRLNDFMGTLFSDYSREKYCRVVIANISGGPLGYSFLPSQNRFYTDPNWVKNSDGVVLHYEALGNESESGFTNRGGILAHELGHWLNLHHPHDGTISGTGQNRICNAIAAEQNNLYYSIPWGRPQWDFVKDTPPMARQWITNLAVSVPANCPNQITMLSGTPPNAIYAACSNFTYAPDQLQNLIYNTMGNAPDFCRLAEKSKAFSPGQRQRIGYSLQFYRPFIYSPENLINTGVACGIIPNAEPFATISQSHLFVAGRTGNGLPVSEFSITPYFSGVTNPTITWTANEVFGAETIEMIPNSGLVDPFEPVTFRVNTKRQRVVTVTLQLSGTYVPIGTSNPVPINFSIPATVYVHPSNNAGQEGKSNLIFGQNAAITNSPAPLAIQNPNPAVFESPEIGKIDTKGGSVTFSNNDGKLVYYASGDKLWNASHQIVLTGLSSEVGSSQYGIVIDKPGEQNAHYFFTVPKHGSQQYTDMGLRVHTIRYYDFSSSTVGQPLPSPPGAPTCGLDNSAKVSEKITVVPGCQPGDYWLIVQGPVEDLVWGKRFYIYKISSSGSISFDHFDDAIVASQTGYIKANTSGEMLVSTFSNVDQATGFGTGVEAKLFTFSRLTGKISAFKSLIVPGITSLATFGASFNGNGSYVFINVNSNDENTNGIITQRAGIYKWDLRNVSTFGGTLNGSLVDLIPYGVSPSQDLLLDGNDRILISNTLDPKIHREALDRWFDLPLPNPNADPDDWRNYAFPLSGRQLGVLYCPENGNPGLSWYGTNLRTSSVVEDPSTQNYILSKGGLGNFVDAKELNITQTNGLTQGHPKVISTGVACCPNYDAVNVACTGNDDAAHGNDFYYSFKVTRTNPSVAFKELRLSTGESDFTGNYVLEFLNEQNDWSLVENSYEESLGNGKYWSISGSSISEFFLSPNPTEAVFRLSMNANSPSASGFFKLRMAYGVFTSPYFEFTGASCCRMALDGVVEEDLKGEEIKAFSIYPNPGQGRFTVEGLEEDQAYFITDMSGRKVMQGHVKSDLLEANTLAPGVYQLRFPQRPDLKHVKLVIQP